MTRLYPDSGFRIPNYLLLCLLFFAPLVSASPLTVHDSRGNAVTLAQPAQRVVTLAPHAAELVAAAGALAQLVAVSDYSDTPEAVRRLPKVGGAGRWNEEALIAQRPDLIVTPAYGLVLIPARLRDQIPVYVADPKTPEGIADDIAALGVLTGHPDVAAAEATRLRQRLAAITPPATETPPKVLYVIWNTPLYVLGGNNLINTAITRCGGHNVFTERLAQAFIASPEVILAQAPDLILMGADAATSARWQHDWQRFSSLPAVERGAIRAINPDLLHRPGPRFVEGMEELCKAIGRQETGDGRQ